MTKKDIPKACEKEIIPRLQDLFVRMDIISAEIKSLQKSLANFRGDQFSKFEELMERLINDQH